MKLRNRWNRSFGKLAHGHQRHTRSAIVSGCGKPPALACS
jgi:hypothetical protein